MDMDMNIQQATYHPFGRPVHHQQATYHQVPASTSHSNHHSTSLTISQPLTNINHHHDPRSRSPQTMACWWWIRIVEALSGPTCLAFWRTSALAPSECRKTWAMAILRGKGWELLEDNSLRVDDLNLLRLFRRTCQVVMM